MLRTSILALALLLAAAPAVARANDRAVGVRGSDRARTLHSPSRSTPVRVRHRARHVPAHSSVHVRRDRHGHHSRRCRHVAGHTVVRIRNVTVRGRYVTTEKPARYAVRWDPRRRTYVPVLVKPRRIVKTWIPRHTETRRKRVWVPARWRCVGH